MSTKITAYQCTGCHRTYSAIGNANRHEAACIRRPENKTCKTCKHFLPADEDEPRACDLDEFDLTHELRRHCAKWEQKQ